PLAHRYLHSFPTRRSSDLFGAQLQFGFLSIPFTIIWIVGITNAINLIDGLDGLAAGVSSIALISISGIAFIQGYLYVFVIGLIVDRKSTRLNSSHDQISYA